MTGSKKISRQRRACLDRISDEETLIFLEGPEFDEAIIGLCDRFGFEGSVVAYDRNKVLKVFMDQGMTDEEAEEFFSFNTIGAWMGERTPVFITAI